MPRKSPAHVTVDPNVRCLRIYPVENSNKQVRDLKTVGIRLNPDQAIHLARALLAVSQEWQSIDSQDIVSNGGNPMERIT